MALEFPTEVGIILLFSLLGGVLAVRFRQPSVIGLLLIGMLVGPHNLGFVTDDGLLFIVMEVGATLLMFAVGAEFNITKLRKYGLPILLVGLAKMGGVFLCGYYASKLLGLGNLASIFSGSILMITSTVLFIRILEQKGYSGRQEMPFLVALLILEDIVAIFSITFLSRLASSGDFSLGGVLLQLSIAFLLLVVSYLIVNLLIKPIASFLMRWKSEETFTFFSLVVLGLFTYIAMELKLSPTIGAFLAGNLLASLPQGKSLEHAMHPFTLTFSSLFFFSIGARVGFASLLENLWMILALSLVLIASAGATMFFSTYIFAGFSRKQAIFSALSMATIGEFGLLVARESENASLGVDMVSIAAGIILVSAISMTLFINLEQTIQNWLAKPYFLRQLRGLEQLRNYTSSILKLFACKRCNRVQADARNIMLSAGMFAWFILLFILIWSMLTPSSHFTPYVPVGGLVLFGSAFMVFEHLRRLIRDFYIELIRFLPGDPREEKIVYGLMLSMIGIFCLLILLPFMTLWIETHLIELLATAAVFITMIALFRNAITHLKRLEEKR